MLDAYINTVLTDANVAGGRVYAGEYPQDTAFPVVNWENASEVHDEVHDGESGAVEERWNFNCYAQSYSASRDTARELWEALKAVEGTVTVDFVIRRVHLEDAFRTEHDPEAKLYMTPVDVTIQFDTKNIPST